MTQDEINETLRLHKMWVRNEEGGSRANLSRANLSRADLIGVNLRRANLRRANLRRADLRGADLSGVNLSRADLRGADLRDADLSGADLRDADLRGFDLSGVNLRGAKYAGNEIRTCTSSIGLYDYHCLALLMIDGTEIIRLGCHERARQEWDADFWNNESEFPNDGSKKSNHRLAAYRAMCEWLDIEKEE